MLTIGGANVQRRWLYVDAFVLRGSVYNQGGGKMSSASQGASPV